MRLSDYLSEADLRPSAFARQIGVPPSTILRIMKGEREPGLDLMRKVMAATGGKVMPNDWLYESLLPKG